RKAFYLFAFAQPFSRYADSRLGRFIREALKPRLDKQNYVFPLRTSVRWVNYWERITEFGVEVIQRNPLLALHLVQSRTGAKVQYKNNAPEVDHIFPRSGLRKRDVDQADIEHFANLWIL